MRALVSSSFAARPRSQTHQIQLVMVLSGVCFLLSCLVLIQLFRSDTTETGNSSIDKVSFSVGTVSLLVPEITLEPGYKLSQAKLKTALWPRNQVAPDVILDSSELQGLYAKDRILSGVPIQRSMLTSEPRNISLAVSDYMRAISIEVDPVTGLEGYAQANRRVDVILTHQQDGFTKSHIVVQNSKVLSYNGDTTPLEQKKVAGVAIPVIGKTITLEVTPEDALYLTVARQMGRLSLILRASGDNQIIQDSEITNARIDGKPIAKPQDPHCIRGHIKMQGQDYIIDCNDKIHLVQEP